MQITIGSINEEWTGLDSDNEPIEPDEFMAYISIDVIIDEQIYAVGTMVGAHECNHGSIRAAGCGVRPYLDTWFTDSADTANLPSEYIDLVRVEIRKNAKQLWYEVESLREK